MLQSYPGRSIGPHDGGLRRAIQRFRARHNAMRLLYLFGVGVPVFLSMFYYGLIASKRYVSEADFVVRGVTSRRMTGLEMLFQTFGVSRTVDDTNSVQNFMLSRDAVRDLEKHLPLRAYFGNPAADIFARFPRFWRSDSFERLFDYYLDRVSVIQDSTKGIATLKVVAFAPDEAQSIAHELLKSAERMVNRMNVRIQADSVRSGQAEVEIAEKRLVEAQKKLTEFRTREMLIDPAKNSTSLLDTITVLSQELSQTLAEIAEKQQLSAATPSLPALKSKAASLSAGIAAERGNLAGGAEDGLAVKLAAYEQLNLQRQLAEKGLAGAMVSLETARQEAQRQQIYLETIVAPNFPDEAMEPQRLRAIITAFVFSFAMVSVIWLLIAGAKEHEIE